MSTNNRGDLVLTVYETGKLLKLSRGSIYHGIRSGQIPHIKVGRRILIPRVALERFLEQVNSAENNQNGNHTKGEAWR